jgi:hypothetical protein
MQQENQAAQVQDLESMVAMASRMDWHLIVNQERQLWLMQEIQEQAQRQMTYNRALYFVKWRADKFV